MTKRRWWASLVGSALLAVGLNSVPATTAHATTAPSPARLILTPTRLAALQTRAQAGDPAWLALKAKRDSYLSEMPPAIGVSVERDHPFDNT